MIVTSWKDSGAGYGIRIAKADFETVRQWREIHIDGTVETILRDNRPFTRDCPEIRSVLIREFLLRNNLLNWPKGNPHRLTLTPLGRARFRLAI